MAMLSPFNNLVEHKDEKSGPTVTLPPQLGQNFRANFLRISQSKLPASSDEDKHNGKKDHSGRRAARGLSGEPRWICYFPNCLHHCRRRTEVGAHWNIQHGGTLFEPEKCSKVSAQEANAPILDLLEAQEENIRRSQDGTDGQRDESEVELCANVNCQRIARRPPNRNGFARVDGRVVCGACYQYWKANSQWKAKDLCNVTKIQGFLSNPVIHNPATSATNDHSQIIDSSVSDTQTASSSGSTKRKHNEDMDDLSERALRATKRARQRDGGT